jgi:hypothetical protein
MNWWTLGVVVLPETFLMVEHILFRLPTLNDTLHPDIRKELGSLRTSMGFSAWEAQGIERALLGLGAYCIYPSGTEPA